MFFLKDLNTQNIQNIVKIVDRQKMLNNCVGYQDGCKSEFEMCKSFYNYLNNVYSNINSRNPNIEGKPLSIRNLGCIRTLLLAVQKSESESYWHELADFIHNYNSKEPVSYDEYQLFKTFFEMGTEFFK